MLYLYLLSGIIFVITDSIYLNLIKNYFEKQIIAVQGSAIKINLYGVLLCYLILILGLNYFIIQQNKSILDAFLLGILIYGVYETTSYALLKNWRFETVILDTLWGGILFAITTYVIYFIRKQL